MHQPARHPLPRTTPPNMTTHHPPYTDNVTLPFDPLVAQIEAVLEHRRALVAARTLGLHYAAGQISKLPTEIRDQLTSQGKIESRLRRLEHIDPASATTPAGSYRLEWLQAFIEQDREARREIRRLERCIDELLDCHGTTLRDEPGIGPISAAVLLCEVGDPHRFDRETRVRPLVRHRRRRALLRRRQKPTRQAPARLRRQPAHQLSAAHRVGHPGPQPARRRRPASPEKLPKAKPDAKPAELTNATSPTASSDACGATKNTDNRPDFTPPDDHT